VSTLSGVVAAAAASGLALAMVAPRAPGRLVGLMLCVAGCLTLALELAPSGHAGLYAGVAGAGAVVAAGLAALFVRVPWALPLLALACVPFAVDVHVGHAHGRLLVPLYAVIAGGAFALMWRPRRERDLGLVAWPLALLSLILFTWAICNWYQSAKDLATVRISLREPVQEDKRLFSEFKVSLPKNSHTLIWLRNSADEPLYRWSDVASLFAFANDWRSSDNHYLNEELEQAAQRLVDSALDFLSFQGAHSEADSRKMPDDDIMYRVYDYFQGDERRGREVQIGLGERADRVLAAHNELYMAGSRLGL